LAQRSTHNDWLEKGELKKNITKKKLTKLLSRKKEEIFTKERNFMKRNGKGLKGKKNRTGHTKRQHFDKKCTKKREATGKRRNKSERNRIKKNRGKGEDLTKIRTEGKKTRRVATPLLCCTRDRGTHSSLCLRGRNHHLFVNRRKSPRDVGRDAPIRKKKKRKESRKSKPNYRDT